MPWTPKPAAPVAFSLADSVTALITGDTAWTFLLDWMPIVGNDQYDTATFCSEGPPSSGELDPSDFVGTGNRNPLANAVQWAARIAILRNWAAARAFGAFCEFTTAQTTDWTIWLDQSGPFYPPGGATWGRELHPVPAGATHVRATYWHVSHPVEDGNTWQGRLATFSNEALANRWDLPGADTTHADTAPGPFTYSAALPGNAAFYQGFLVGNNGVQPDGRVMVEFDISDPTGTPYVPPTFVPPSGFSGPATRTYDTIADLGRELDAQELKLDVLLNWVRLLGAHLDLPGTPDDEPVTVNPDEPIEIGDANAVIVTLADIPPYADLEFATPQKIGSVGRVNLGTVDAWLPPVEIEVNPMVLAPIPPGVTRVQVNVKPPIVATVTLVHPPK